MYKRYIRMPLVFGTILYPFIILYALYFDKANLSFAEIFIIWPSTVGILFILRVITVAKDYVKEKYKAAGEKFGENFVNGLFNKKEDTNNG